MKRIAAALALARSALSSTRQIGVSQDLLLGAPVARQQPEPSAHSGSGLAQLPPTLRGVRARGIKPREVVAFHG